MTSRIIPYVESTKIFSFQAQLRITMTDTVSPASNSEYDDFLPLGLVIRVNGRQCTTLPVSYIDR